MPTAFNPAMIVGLCVFVCGMLLMFGVLGRTGGLAFGGRALRNIGALLRSKKRGAKALFWLALSMVVLGGLVTCSAIMAGDASRNKRCRAACKKAGHQSGRFRVNPHVPVREAKKKRLPYRCWCQSEGGGSWSAKPVPVPQKTKAR
jgi:hypothetical protein